MSYIGNSPYQVAFVTDTFSGNGSTTAFTMSVAPANTASVLVVVSGVVQDPSTYSVSGTTLTFTAAPPSATGNISCRYLGIPASGVTTTAYRTVTEFTATAGQTTFTPPSYTVGFINVYRNGSRLGTADYTASNGTTVVLTSAASANDLVTVESFLVSSVLNAIPSTGGSISNLYLDTGRQNGTGSMLLPSGTTAQRPSATTAGQVRYNSTTGATEVYQNGGWYQFTVGLYSISYLIVAGGGGGGGEYYSGGGGAGGLLNSSSVFVLGGTSYTVTVGAGGSGGASSVAGGTGGTSSFVGGGTTITTVGGGGGAGYSVQAATTGGSGGGGSLYDATRLGAAGTSGQGYSGGNGSGYTTYTTTNGGGSGGGGAGGAGENNTGATSKGGTGGIGVYNTISGASVGYAGGGGGGVWTGSRESGAGVPYGAGRGGSQSTADATAATANTGSGGGGASIGTGGNGGSGVVIISYYGTQRGTGGTVTSSGGYTIHTFTSSGTFTA